MSAKLMEETALRVAIDMMNSGLTPQEGMVVLAQIVAVAFRTSDISREEAIRRFTQVVDNVYNQIN